MHHSLDSALGRDIRLNRIGETINSIATPTAAYSLRSLTGGDPLAVRVRRSSNDASAEKDFTVSGINSGALLNHINEDVITEQSDFTSGVDSYARDSHGTVSREASFEGKSDVLKYEFASTGRFAIDKSSVALDHTSSYTISFEYYADTAYNGKFWGVETSFAGRVSASNTPAVVSDAWTSVTLNVPSGRTTGVTSLHIRLQDGTNDTVGLTGIIANVRFKNIVVTQTTGSGFVTIWYDQSGNGNNATQTDTDKQPAIASNGSLLADGLTFDGTNDSLSSSSGVNFTSSDDLSAFLVSNLDSASGQNPIVSQSDGTGTGRSIIETGSTINTFIGGSEQNFGSASASQSIITLLYDDSANTLDAFKNGSQSGSQKTSITAEAASGALNIAKNKAGSQFFDGKINEVIIYLSDQTDNRAALESNIISHYSIS